MHFFRFIVLFIFLVTFLGASNALAGAHHHNHGGHEQTMESPFDKKQEGKSAHCLLNGHRSDRFCPHSGVKVDHSQAQKISVQCHGKESGTVPPNSFQSDFFYTHIYVNDSNDVTSKLVIGMSSSTKQYSDRQVPPPEVL
ncbi:MAG: hypothetical protein H8E32_14710 [Nitrospinae bacterium]|nr:hypothetical protein [Nitrospinota bacterium]